jgi:putative transposase
VTICTQDHSCLFGEIMDGEMRVNASGRMVEKTWCDLPNHYPYVELDAFVVMPNHVHMVIVLTLDAPTNDLNVCRACLCLDGGGDGP